MSLSYNAIKGLIITGISIFVILIGLVIFTERVPEGKVAVVYTPSGGATKVLDAGWHPIAPFHKTQEYPIRVTIMKNNISVSTNDGKKVTMPVSYEMKVNKSKVLNIFKELGSQDIEQIQDGYLYQKLFQASRASVANYSVLDIYGTKTTNASLEITEQMAKSTKDMGFEITNVTLGTPELDQVTQNAIDARVKASQELELKKQQLENERIEALKKKVIAKGNADKKVIEAKGVAEANKIVSNSLTDKILKQQELQARKAHGWVEVQGANAVVTR